MLNENALCSVDELVEYLDDDMYTTEVACEWSINSASDYIESIMGNDFITTYKGMVALTSMTIMTSSLFLFKYPYEGVPTEVVEYVALYKEATGV